MPVEVRETKIESVTKWHVEAETEQKINMVFVKEYDKEGNLIHQVFYDDHGSITSKSSFTYGGGSISESKEIFENGQVKEQVRINYEYNTEGKLVKQEIYKDSTTLAVETIYQYDDKGNLTKKQELNISTGQMTETVYYYSLNEKGQIKERKEFDLGTGNYSGKEEFKYDQDNFKLDVYSYGELENFFKLTTYIYDYDGNIVKEIVADKNGKILDKYIYNYTRF
jgi:hypothetical protein